MDEFRSIDSLDALMGGELLAHFNEALQRTLDNIMDARTSDSAKRSITLEIDFTPGEDRTMVGMKFDVRTKLAPPKSTGTVVYISPDESGCYVASERTKQIPGQIAMDGTETGQKIVRL